MTLCILQVTLEGLKVVVLSESVAMVPYPKQRWRCLPLEHMVDWSEEDLLCCTFGFL